jgi:hypothetical protein
VGYYRRQAHDPLTLCSASHVMLTVVHFLIWVAAYGGVGGTGPSDVSVRQTDDIILSLVVLSGWISLLYFARGLQVGDMLLDVVLART